MYKSANYKTEKEASVSAHFTTKYKQRNINNRTFKLKIGFSSKCKELHEVFYWLQVVAHNRVNSLKVAYKKNINMDAFTRK